MAIRRTYINDIEVVNASNIREASISIDYNGLVENTILTTKERVFIPNEIGSTSLADPFDAINNWMDSGFMFSGIPYRETLSDGVDTVELINGLIDCRSANIACDNILVDIIETKANWYADNAGFTFEYLFEQTEYKNHPSYKIYPTPYTISKRQGDKIALTIVSSISQIFQVFDIVNGLTYILTNSAAFEWGEWIALVVYLIEAIALILASLQMMIILYQLLVQPIKYHLTMKSFDLFTVGFAFLGLNFKSSIFEDNSLIGNTVLLDVKNNDDFTGNDNIILDILNLNLDVITGFTSANNAFDNEKAYPIETFEEFVEKQKKLYNANLFFDGDTVRLERRDYAPDTNLYRLPDVEQLTHGTNAKDIIASTTYKFQEDTQDENTINDREGFAIVSSVGVNSGKPKDTSLLGGANVVNFGYSLARVKKEQDKIEIILQKFFEKVEPLVGAFIFQHNVKIKTVKQTVNTMIDLIETIVNAIPGVSGIDIPTPGFISDLQQLKVPKLSTLIGDRRGMLMLESDNVGVQKLFVIDEHYIYNNADTGTTSSWAQNVGITVASQLLVGSPALTLSTFNQAKDTTIFTSSGLNSESNRIHPLNYATYSALNIYNFFYYIDSFAMVNGLHNQYEIREISNVPFCFSDLQKVIKTKNIKTFADSEAEIITFEFDEDKNTANIKYRENKMYATGLIPSIFVSNGSKR